MNNAYINEQIKEAVSMRDVISRYGFKLGKNGRMPCPFHGGRDENLGIIKDRAFNCFVCGAKGDIFDFVMKLFNIPFGKALNKLCEDFSLPYGNCMSLSQKERDELIRRSDEVKRQRLLREQRRKQLEDECWELRSTVLDLEDDIERYSPKWGDEEKDLHPRWKYAVDNVEAVRYEMYLKEEELKDFE